MNDEDIGYKVYVLVLLAMIFIACITIMWQGASILGELRIIEELLQALQAGLFE